MTLLNRTLYNRFLFLSASALTFIAPLSAEAGGYMFARDFPGIVAHPTGYTGTGGTLDVRVCILPSSPNASKMEQSIKNNIAVWNNRQSTTANLRNRPLPANTYDFESVALHELGHCVGLSHPNLGSQSGVSGANTNYSVSLAGPDTSFGFNSGNDNIIGSADDIRGDDDNLHFFYPANNNPFSENAVVDTTTYTRDVAQLPVGDFFPANADRQVSNLPRYAAPFTEASMQQGTFNDEIQRTLSHDDVSTLRYASAGFDGQQGTADDHRLNLIYGGISTNDCDISVSMSSQTGFASCRISGQREVGNEHIRITNANIFFSPNIDWYYNDTPPCNESISLIASAWKMISLPCQVGISTSATVADVLGDDLGLTSYDDTWAVFNYEYSDQAEGNYTAAYTKLNLTDELENGKGYWIITTDSNKTVDVQGEYNSQMDAPLFVNSANSDSTGWNLYGMPFRFSTAWADTQVIDENGDVLSLLDADPAIAGAEGNRACTSPATADCLMSRIAYTFDESTGEYKVLSNLAGTLDRFDAVWVLAGKSGISMRIPMSNQERTSP